MFEPDRVGCFEQCPECDHCPGEFDRPAARQPKPTFNTANQQHISSRSRYSSSVLRFILVGILHTNISYHDTYSVYASQQQQQRGAYLTTNAHHTCYTSTDHGEKRNRTHAACGKQRCAMCVNTHHMNGVKRHYFKRLSAKCSHGSTVYYIMDFINYFMI